MEIKIRVDTNEGEEIMILTNEHFDNFNYVDMYFKDDKSEDISEVYSVPVEELYLATNLLNEHRKSKMKQR